MQLRADPVLRLEHQQIKQHPAEIAQKLAQDELATESEAGALLGVLGRYNENGESTLYPTIDQAVMAQKRSVRFVQMQQIPSAQDVVVPGAVRPMVGRTDATTPRDSAATTRSALPASAL